MDRYDITYASEHLPELIEQTPGITRLLDRLAATLNGVFFYLRSTVGRGTIEGPLAAVAPWIGLVLAAILAAAVTVVLSALIRRELAHATASSEAPS